MVVKFIQQLGDVLLLVYLISVVEIIGVKLLNIVVVRLQVSEKFVMCILVGIILVSVGIIVLLYMLQINDSYSSMFSIIKKFGVFVSMVSVGQVVVSVSRVMVISIDWWLKWLDSVLFIGSQKKLEIVISSVISRLLEVLSISIFLLKVGVQMVIRQNVVVVIVIIIILVIIICQFVSRVVNIWCIVR